MINFLLNLSLMLCVVFSASKDNRSAEFLSYQIDLDNTILAELPPNSYNEWIYLTNDRIKVKYSSNFEIPWCRSSANFRFSQDEIYNALKDLKNYKNIFDRVSVSKLLNQEDGIAYIRLNMPWPYSDRDYTVRFIESRDNNDIIFQFYSVAHPNTPNNTGSVTLPRAGGEWRLNYIDSNRTHVTYTWNGELLGNFPDYGLTTAWETQGSEVMIWLNEYLKGRRNNN